MQYVNFKKLLIVLLFSLPLFITGSCSSYKGDGYLVQRRTFSFYPIYEIYFPPFSFDRSEVVSTYTFAGVSNRLLELRLYVLSKSEQRVKFPLYQIGDNFIEKLNIAVNLEENDKEVVNIKNARVGFGGNFYSLYNPNSEAFFFFSSRASYKLRIVVETKENPPVPLKIQFALSYGYGCATKPCKEVLWKDLLKK